MLWIKASLFLWKDEECIRPGPATDLSFLEKLEEKVGKHAHFQTYVSHLTSRWLGKLIIYPLSWVCGQWTARVKVLSIQKRDAP